MLLISAHLVSQQYRICEMEGPAFFFSRMSYGLYKQLSLHSVRFLLAPFTVKWMFRQIRRVIENTIHALYVSPSPFN